MEHYQNAADFYRAHILETISSHETIDRELTKKRYAPAMERYREDCREIFENLDCACEGGVMTPQEAAACFLDQLEARWDKKGRRDHNRMDRDKVIIAIFLVPMIRTLELDCGEDYCTSLQEQWCSRYPKSVFFVGSYENILAGFRDKRFGFCFITTAVCENEGKADDCAELTAFRAFRDGYLRTCPDGDALIEEYYATAPAIVLAIDRMPDRDARYAAIRQEHLAPCYEDLQAGRLEACKERYVRMVRQLQQQYLS